MFFTNISLEGNLLEQILNGYCPDGGVSILSFSSANKVHLNKFTQDSFPQLFKFVVHLEGWLNLTTPGHVPGRVDPVPDPRLWPTVHHLTHIITKSSSNEPFHNYSHNDSGFMKIIFDFQVQ